MWILKDALRASRGLVYALPEAPIVFFQMLSVGLGCSQMLSDALMCRSTQILKPKISERRSVARTQKSPPLKGGWGVEPQTPVGDTMGGRGGHTYS